MSTEKAEIQHVSGGGLRIVAGRHETCGKCTLRQGCGQYLLRRRNRLVIDIPFGSKSDTGMTACGSYHPGDAIELQLAEGRVSSLVIWFYGVPLATMLAAVAIGVLLDLNEVCNMILAAAGLVLGISSARHYLGQEAHAASFLPAINLVSRVKNTDPETSGYKENK
jgi:positive regulator of sigma E activity